MTARRDGAWSRHQWQYRLRRLRPADMPTVVAMWREQCPLPDDLRQRLPNVLEYLLANQHVFGLAVERLRQPGGTWEVAAFGVGGFMADGLRQRYLRAPFGFLAAHVLERVAGNDTASVLLSREEVARRQMRREPTLDYMVLCWLQDNYDFTDMDARQLLLQGIRLLDRYVNGLRLRSLLLEGQAFNRPAFEMAGFGRLIDCADKVPEEYLPLTRREDYVPYLHGLHAWDDIRERRFLDPLARLFVISEPVLGLTESQKEVLDLALDGFADRAIAGMLGISSNAVHMRWRGIYDKAAVVLPELARIDEACDKGYRGMEKRRVVLEYIRDHPQEIRTALHMPWNTSENG